MQRFYGLPLGVVDGSMSWRRLGVLIRGLPEGSALARSAHGPEADISLAVRIAAYTFDAIQVGNWQRAGNKNAQRPQSILPSTGKRLGTAKLTAAEMRTRLDRWRRGSE